MNPGIWTSVDEFLAARLSTTDEVVEAALRSCRAANLPDIQVTSNQGRLLQLLAQTQGARRILEIGTLGGYSTIFLARSLPNDGCLISLEVEPTYAQLARENVSRAGLSHLVTILVASATESLAKLTASGAAPFDFIFLDADKQSYPEYFAFAMQLSKSGTVIVADNIVRKGAVLDPVSSDEAVQGVRRMLELVAAEPRVCATAIQTVGTKGYDGFLIATVR